MRHDQPTPKQKYFQLSLEMFVVNVLSCVRWQTVLYMWTRNTEVLVAENVVRQWNDACSDRSGQRSLSATGLMSLAKYAAARADNDWCTMHASIGRPTRSAAPDFSRKQLRYLLFSSATISSFQVSGLSG